MRRAAFGLEREVVALLERTILRRPVTVLERLAVERILCTWRAKAHLPPAPEASSLYHAARTGARFLILDGPPLPDCHGWRPAADFPFVDDEQP